MIMDEAHAQGCSFEWDIDALFAAVKKKKRSTQNDDFMQPVSGKRNLFWRIKRQKAASFSFWWLKSWDFACSVANIDINIYFIYSCILKNLLLMMRWKIQGFILILDRLFSSHLHTHASFNHASAHTHARAIMAGICGIYNLECCVGV